MPKLSETKVVSLPMQLIVITPEQDVSNETEVVNSLFAAGLQRLHLRKPGYGTKQYREYIKTIDEQYHSRIVLCNAFELWREFELGGIHLNSHMREDVATWKRIMNVPAGSISASFHSWQEIIGHGHLYRYIFISPVFDSISKQGYKAAIDLDGAERLRQENAYAPPIIGLGGVGVSQLEILHQHGFYGAAMLGSIWQATEPVKMFEEMLAITTSLAGR